MPRLKLVDASGNRLLASLSRSDRAQVLAQGERVQLVPDELLHEGGKPLCHVYFPIQGYVALVTPLDACAGLEVALIGNEGMVGISPILDVAISPLHHLVQGAGTALRIGIALFRQLLDGSPSLRRRLSRYVCVILHQIAQTAACTRFHVVEERLARWMLMTHDRSQSDEFHATHEFLAYMLGVRRVGITKAATALQERGLIRYRRGDIVVLDRAGLEARSCGCYKTANELYERVLG